MAKNTGRNIGIVLVIAVIGGGSFFLITQIGGGEFGVLLPVLQQLTDDGFVPLTSPSGAIIVDGIDCKIKQNLQVFSFSGAKLFEIDSVGLQGSPFIPQTLVDPNTQLPVGWFKVTLKTFCSGGGANVVVLSSSVVQETQGTLANGSPSAKVFKLSSTNQKTFVSGTGEQDLITFLVYQREIDPKLSLADYNSDLTFSIFGKLKVAYQGFESFPYEIQIFQKDIQTKYTASVLNSPETIKPPDDDNDGIANDFDLCPTLKEDGFGISGGSPDPSDGCPAPFVIDEPVDDPPVDDPPMEQMCLAENDVNSCMATCEAQQGVFIQGGTDSLGNTIASFCDLTAQASQCDIGEKLVLTTGNIFRCEIDPDADEDRDGVPDLLDACPNTPIGADVNSAGCESPVRPLDPNCQADDVIKGFVQDGQCTILGETPEPAPEPTEVTEELLKGRIINVGTVTFSDSSVDVFVGDGGSTSIEGFISDVGVIAPLELVGTLTGDEKVVDRYEYEVLYVFPTVAEARATILTDSDIVFKPTLFVSSTQEKSGMFTQQFGAVISQSGSALQRGDQGFFGFSLGKSIISANEFELLSREFITEGQARKVGIVIQSEGQFEMSRSSVAERFNVVDAFVIFNGFTINNEVVPKGLGSCPSNTVAEYDLDGNIIECNPVTPTTQTCTTDQRPQGFICSQSFIDQFCPNGVDQLCNEPDRDLDGIPDILDGCPTLREDGIGDTFEERTDGCPFVGDDPCKDINSGICEPPKDKDPPKDGGCVVSAIDPRLCPPEGTDTTTLLIIGGIGLLIVGVIVIAVRRRRSRVFGV